MGLVVAIARLKVCGLKSLEDVETLDGLADYLGFIVSREKVSPRILEPKKAAELASTVSKSVPVLVIHGFEVNEAVELASKLEVFRVVQYHWPEKPKQLMSLYERLAELGVRLAPVVFYGVGGWSPLHPLFYKSVAKLSEYLLVDAPKSSRVVYEEGLRIPVDAVRDASRHIERLGVAGGITPSNVCRVARYAWLVDVSSGVEREGRKDRRLVEALLERIEACRRASMHETTGR